MATPDQSNSNNEVLSEWQAARDVLARFDENLHDLEKYGFSFITGLLTIDALFGQINPEFKLAALIGTLALIVVLDVVDRNYRVFQQGAAQRATLLENRSNPELTKTIARTYEQTRTRRAFRLVYQGLAIITFILGIMVLPASLLYQLSNFAALLVASAFLWRIEESLDLRPWVYFEVDGFRYKKPSEVLVVVTHFGKPQSKSITLRDDVWGVYHEDGRKVPGQTYQRFLRKQIKIRPGGDHRWTFPTKNLVPGLYRVVYKGPIYGPPKTGYKVTRVRNNRGLVSSGRWNYSARFWIVE